MSGITTHKPDMQQFETPVSSGYNASYAFLELELSSLNT
jgi:hypothetical protein